MERRLHLQVQAVAGTNLGVDAETDPLQLSLRALGVLTRKTEGLGRLELFQQPFPIAQRLTTMSEAQFQKDFVSADLLAGRNIFANLLHRADKDRRSVSTGLFVSTRFPRTIIFNSAGLRPAASAICLIATNSCAIASIGKPVGFQPRPWSRHVSTLLANAAP